MTAAKESGGATRTENMMFNLNVKRLSTAYMPRKRSQTGETFRRPIPDAAIMKYAIVTGASRGLGAAFAEELARRRINLVLVSLPDPRLAQVVGRCRAYGVEVEFFETDLTVTDNVIRLCDHINARFDVFMLINNAGSGGSCAFDSCDYRYVDRIIQLNVTATALMTHRLLRNLRRNAEAYVLNISSMASLTPSGYKTVYPASKAFVRHFSAGMNAEFHDSQVHVAVAMPGAMATNDDVCRRIERQGILGRLTLMTPQKVAAACIKGLLKGETTIIPGILNKLNVRMLSIIPAGLKARMMSIAVKKREL